MVFDIKTQCNTRAPTECTSSAIVSALVLFVTNRPISRYRTELFLALVALVLVDVLSDLYMLWSGEGRRCVTLVSLATKVVLSGTLALLVARSAQPHVIYAMVGLMVVGNFVLSVIHDRWEEALFMFGGAILASFVLHLLFTHLTRKRER